MLLKLDRLLGGDVR